MLETIFAKVFTISPTKISPLKINPLYRTWINHVLQSSQMLNIINFGDRQLQLQCCEFVLYHIAHTLVCTHTITLKYLQLWTLLPFL